MDAHISGERRGSTHVPKGRPAAIGVGSAVAVALTWLLQAAVGRVLGPESYAAFMVAWGVVFLVVGLLLGLQQEVTRAVATQQARPAGEGGEHPAYVYAVYLGLVIGLGGALVAVASSPLWGQRLFGPDWLSVTVATAFGFLTYALYNAVNGVLAGRQRWNDYAISIVIDSLVRLVLVLPIVLLPLGLAGQAWALNAAAVGWMVLLGRRGFRKAVRCRLNETLKPLSEKAFHAMLATGCSAIMISGFPVLLQMTTRAPLGPEAGVVVAAVIATRAPLLLPLNAFQAVVLTRFVAARDEVGRTLVRLLSIMGAATIVGMLAGYLVGPELLGLIYGDQFRIEGMLLAALVSGGGLIAMQMLTGSAVMAAGRHRLYAAGWLLSAAVAVIVLSTGLSVEARSAFALNVGPLAGLTVNVSALTPLRRQRSVT